MVDKIIKSRISPKQKKAGNFPFDFKAPSYDNRTSCSISAGDDYGVGYRQPIGSKKGADYDAGPIPLNSRSFNAQQLIEHEDIEG